MIDEFVAMVAETAVSSHIYNQYAGDTAAAAVCRRNLAAYLRVMQAQRPTVLLLGEAAGYRGCRLTGVPFTSEAVLLGGKRPFSNPAAFAKTDEWPTVCREASATIVWETLAECAALPLIWNALPFHPHQPGRPYSNRTPKTSELALGEPLLRQLLPLFAPLRLVAVGNKAAEALARWGLDAVAVRHPSHGGKRPFQSQLRLVLEVA
ncbi:MAG: uracil-DNA glycosylase [Chloroflexota bacterium]